MGPVFRTLEIAAKTLVAATGTKITWQNLENIPHSPGTAAARHGSREGSAPISRRKPASVGRH
jgi:hypothetical protein